MQNLSLILEGGALRSLYTSGVLDVLMKYNIEADYVLGVSAGALTGMNYVAKQKERTAKINIEFCDDPRYIGRKALRKEKGLIGYDYLLIKYLKKIIHLILKHLSFQIRNLYQLYQTVKRV